MLSQVTVKLTKNWLKVKQTDCSQSLYLRARKRERASTRGRRIEFASEASEQEEKREEKL